MDTNAILKEVNNIFKLVLDDDDIDLQRNITADEVDDWDSLNHIQLIVGIEKHFKIRFSSSQIRSWLNVGEMCDEIETMLRD